MRENFLMILILFSLIVIPIANAQSTTTSTKTIEISSTQTLETTTIGCPNNCILNENTCTCPTEGTCTSYIDNKSCTVVECTDGSGSTICPKPNCESSCTLSGNTCTCPVSGICTSHVDDKGCTVTECTGGIGTTTCPKPDCESPCILSGNICTCPVSGICTVHTNENGCTVVECTDGSGSTTCPKPNCESSCTLSGNTCTCPTIETKPVEAHIETVSGTETISINKRGGTLSLTANDVSAITTEKLIVEGSKLYIETSAGNKEINVLPEEASSKATEIARVEKIELKEENTKPIYSIFGTKESKILFLISASMKIETKVDAESGEVILVNKPWWSFLAW